MATLYITFRYKDHLLNNADLWFYYTCISFQIIFFLVFLNRFWAPECLTFSRFARSLSLILLFNLFVAWIICNMFYQWRNIVYALPLSIWKIYRDLVNLCLPCCNTFHQDTWAFADKGVNWKASPNFFYLVFLIIRKRSS